MAARKCEIEGCGYSTAKYSHFVAHARTHTGERPYSCEVESCGYTATTRGSLERHGRTHTGERPYSCEVEGCGYTATERGGLARHMRTHKKADLRATCARTKKWGLCDRKI